MRKQLIALALALVAICTRAVTVNCEPGRLAKLLPDASITQLTVTGRMDARDFRFIADHLRQLQSLDLHEVYITAYSGGALFGNVRDYQTSTLPTMALAQMQRLNSLTLPPVTAIGEAALAGCAALRTLTLPYGMKHLGNYALAGCTALENVVLSPQLETIGEGAFAHCSALTTVEVDTTGTMQPIGSPRFNEKPGQVTTIGAHAFEGCKSLRHFNVGNRLTTIGDRAFAGTQLRQIDLSAMPALASVGDWAFAQSTATEATLPQQLSTLGRGAFVLNTTLRQVTLPASLTRLQPLTLAGNTTLTAVDLKRTVIDTVGDYALYKLNKVSELAIPATTTHIGTRAMAGMTALRQIVSQADDAPSLGEAVWDGVRQSDVTLKVPAQSLNEYMQAMQWQDFTIVSSALAGDVNDDGEVDIADLNAIINYLLNRPNQTFIYDAADLDGNGTIDIADINALVNIMLNHTLAQPSTAYPNTGDQLLIDNFTIHTGNKKDISLRLDNTVAYTALQCTIHLPNGLKLVDGTLALGNRVVTHRLSSMVANGEIRVIIYAMPNIDITGDCETPILNMKVKATNELPDIAAIMIDHVTMVTADGDIYHAAPSLTQVSRNTGVNDVTTANDKVYAANGTLHIRSAQGGVAQLVAMTGATRTLQVAGGDNTYHNIDPGIYVVRINGRSYKVRI